MAVNLGRRTILGLDLGVTSVGWALIEYDGQKPVKILATGVRHFDTAATNAKDFAAGTHKTKNADRRRPQRHMRRQLNRRKQRKKQAFQALQAAGLLPAASATSEDQRHKIIRQVDGRLRRKWMVKGDHRKQQLLPYLLRDAATRRQVTAEELGRALYHLAQRRGFKSNRKTDRDEDDKSTVYEGIGTLESELQAAGCETYGQYFATLDPQRNGCRIRGRYTSRQHYEREFDKIIDAQRPFHPQLAQHAKAIRRAIFFQNPLKSQRRFLGSCELYGNRRRAPKACLAFQCFRICQQVNNLSLVLPNGYRQPLAPEERETLYKALQGKHKLTSAGVLKELGFKRNSGHAIHGIGESGKEIIGNRTACELRGALGDVWDGLRDEQQARLVDEITQFTNPEALARRLAKEFGLSLQQATAAARARIEGDYASYSRVALQELLPLLKAGRTLPSAIEEVCGHSRRPRAQVATERGGRHSRNPETPLLPPLGATRCGRHVRNPVVIRCLTELRKVVNHILRDPALGRPDEIRIELMRDLKRSRKVREARHRTIKKNTDRNKQIEHELQTQPETERFFRTAPPRRSDVDKWKLYEECQGMCPYTGQEISPGDLYGPNPQFDVEHIVPASRFPDNSLANKTLCEHKENRERKKGQTPWEAYHETDQYAHILRRVKAFKGPLSARKLELFQRKELPAQMSAQQLVDSQYSAALAAEYLGEVYGGQVDSAGRRRVSASNGRVTAHLRALWRLNEILGSESAEKNRADLRHHAVDALVVALTTPGAVAALARFVQEGESLGLDNPFAARHRRRAKPFDLPWAAFREEAEREILSIVVSHRPEHRLRGQLHKDTMYGAPGRRGAEDPNRPTQRVALCDLSRKAIEGNVLVSPLVRRCVLEKLRSLDQPGKPASPEVFKDTANLPEYPGRNGQSPHIIRRVKTYRSASKTIHVRNGNPGGRYEPGGNHHVPILVEVDDAGHEKHDGEGRSLLSFGKVVSRFDAVRRLTQDNTEVVNRVYDPGLRLKFTLMRGDLVEMADDDKVRRIYRMMNLSDGDYRFRAVHLAEGDNNSLKERRDLYQRIRSNTDFSKRFPRKVIVDPLGRVHNSGG